MIQIVKHCLYNSCLSDSPGEPVGPITFSEISEGKVTLSWNPPENDGCSEVTHYILEKRETSKISWALVTDECLASSYTATKLIKTNEYQFRVSAVNRFGVSRPLDSAPVIAQMQYSKILKTYLNPLSPLPIISVKPFLIVFFISCSCSRFSWNSRCNRC